MPRILVVDDDLASLDAICKHLTRCDHTVDCVENGKPDSPNHSAPETVIPFCFLEPRRLTSNPPAPSTIASSEAVGSGT